MALYALAALAQAQTLELPDRTETLRQVSWTQKDGAPIHPNDMAQTQDGLLWLGGATGLYRFNGTGFERIELAGAPQLQILRLFAAKDGALWIGYMFNGVARLANGELRSFGYRDGLPGGGILAFAQQSDGTLWVGTPAGLARLRSDRWEALDSTWKWPQGAAETLMVDSQDRLWIRRQDRVFVLPANGHQISEVKLRFGSGINFVESSDGAVWLAGENGLELLGTNPPTGKARWSLPASVVFADDGSLWVRPSSLSLRSAAASALKFSVPPSHVAFRKPMEPGIDAVSGGWGEAMLLDNDGNVWSRTNTSIVRLSPRSFLSLSSMPGWRSSSDILQRAIAPVGHSSIVLGDALHVGASTFDGRDFRAMPVSDAVTCAARTRSDVTWIAGQEGRLWRITGSRLEPLDPPAPLRGKDVIAIAEDREDGLWIAGETGVYRLAGGRWSAWGELKELPRSRVYAITDDRAGRLWFGYSDGRVALVDGRQARVFGLEDGLRVGPVSAIYAHRGSVWVGGDTGLARFDGRRWNRVVSDGADVLYLVKGIVETEDGEVWLSTGAGVVRLPAKELAIAATDPSHKIWSEVFDAVDGISGTNSFLWPVPSLVESGDGLLWAATNEDVYRIDPRHLDRRPVLPVTLQAFVVDGRPYPIGGSQTLPTRARTLKFSYGGGSLSAGKKIRYRYRLDAVDTDWHSVHEAREVTYSNLAPGHYRFRVQDTWAGYPWPATETVFDFQIPPAFVQTRLFLLLCVAAAMAVIWGLARWGAHQLAKPMRIRFEARLAERLRIARDLHDTLLQSVLGVILVFQHAASKLDSSHPARGQLDRALEVGNAGIMEARDRIMGLRLQTSMPASLADSLSAIAAQFRVRGAEVHFDIDVQGPPRALLPGVHEEVYCIAREALSNAFRHAEASAIRVCLAYVADALSIRIRDNGRGIAEGVDPARGRPGHWGLSGMFERAQLIGGTLTVHAVAGGGTEVEIRIPASLAFEKRARAAWALPWRRHRNEL